MAKKFNWVSGYGLAALVIGIIWFYWRWQNPTFQVKKESFVSKKCPDGTRSDGPCLMEFPSA